MDKQVQKEYESKLETFSTEGWKLIESEMKELLKVATETSANDCPTNDLWQVRRGNLQTLTFFCNYADMVRYHYKTLVEDGNNVGNL